MKKKIFLTLFTVVGLVLVTAIGLYFYVTTTTSSKREVTYSPPSAEIDEAVQNADLALGERIVKVRNGCTDCHGADLAGAKVMDNGAMGTIYGPNITPHATQNWSNQDFVNAIRHGIGKDKTALVLMPSHEYHALSKKDLGAVIAYLKTLPSKNNTTPEISLGPIAQALLAFEKAPSLLPAQLIDHQAPFPDKPQEASSSEFGAYLAKTTCSGCHGPEYKGGPIPGGPPDWPEAANLTQMHTSWSYADFEKAMLEGQNPQGEILKEPMPKLKFNTTELQALWLHFGGKI